MTSNAVHFIFQKNVSPPPWEGCKVLFYIMQGLRDYCRFKTFVLKYASFSVNHNQQPKTLLLVISASHPNVQYVADFAPELGLIIMETKYLEQLGFQVPELARNVALQVCRGKANSVSCRFSQSSSNNRIAQGGL